MVVVVMVRVVPAAMRRVVWDLMVGDHPRVLLGVATVDAATMVPVMMSATNGHIVGACLLVVGAGTTHRGRH